MIDTHAHLNFSRFKKTVPEVVALAKAVGVDTIVVPGTDIDSSRKAVEIAGSYEGIYAAVGIHPHHAFGEFKVAELEALLKNKKVVAIGEIGLDRHEYKDTKYANYHVDEDFIEVQKALFIAQLDLAKKYQKSVIIHNREAKADILPLITEHWPSFAKASEGKSRMVFHCCEPDPELLEFATHYNIYIGVDGDVTYWKEKADFIKTVLLEKLVLETDSPFLLPEPLRTQERNSRRAEPKGSPSGRRPNVPANIPLIAEFIASLKGVSVEEVAKQTTENAQQLFGLE